MSISLRVCVCSFVVCGALWLAGIACDAQTAGVKIEVQAAVVGASSGGSPAEFENQKGWKIKLDKAHMLVGPVYLYEGLSQVRLWDYLRPWRVALAHPGHVDANGRKVLAEFLGQQALDLLKSEPSDLGRLKGIEGSLQSVDLELTPPGAGLPKDATEQLGGAMIFVAGTATKGDDSRPFQLALTVPDEGTMRTVKGIDAKVPLEADKVAAGRLVLQVRIDSWFTSVDFSHLTEQNSDGKYLLDATNAAILQGVRSRHSYSVEWR